MKNVILNFKIYFPYISSVQFSHSVVSDSFRPHELQHARPPCPSPTHFGVIDNRASKHWPKSIAI